MDLRATLATCADPAFASDASGKIVAWNRAAEELTGLRRDRVLGRPCAEVLAGRDVHGNLHCTPSCIIRQQVGRGEPVHRFQLALSVPAGQLTISVSVLCLLTDASGGPLYIHLLEEQPEERPGQPAGLAAGGTRRSAPRRCPPPPGGQEGRQDACRPDRGPLTPREREVLGLLAQGADIRRIARKLGISHATTRSHVQHVLDKLNVHSQLQAVVVAFRDGLL